jgi:hypothetical protein
MKIKRCREVIDFIPPLCFSPIHPGSASRPRHDAARGSSGERRPTTTPLLPPQAALACLRGWSAGRRLLRYPFGSHPDGTHEGAFFGRNSQSRPVGARLRPGAGLALLRLPHGGPRKPSGVSRRSIPHAGKKEKRDERACPGPKTKKQGGAALAFVIPGERATRARSGIHNPKARD